MDGRHLISMNPYRQLPGMYQLPEPPVRPQPPKDVPHLYHVAERAHGAMSETGENQSILISGESGAGKTEAAKHVMRYLSALSLSHKNKARVNIENVVLDSNVVLEAFGNAKTSVNDNSSRFGKYTQIEYGEAGAICGASTRHFLLEKSRVVLRPLGECSFHAFYQITDGIGGIDAATASHLSPLYQFGPSSQYRYLDGSENAALQLEMPLDEQLAATCRSMETVGISPVRRAEVFVVVAAILELGNVQFEKISAQDEEAGSAVTADSMPHLARACEFLGMDCHQVARVLCERTVRAGARGSIIKVKMSVQEAQEGRNALAKIVYARLFAWLVGRVNNASKPDRGTHFIGILDIFGFEVLETNGFEQLCINYANEVLQRTFNHHVFHLEQQLYVSEGIDWTRLTFKDNQAIIDLLSQSAPPPGIFPLLDEQGMLGKRGGVGGLLASLDQTHKGKHPRYAPGKFGNESFIIKHYAGDVAYAVTKDMIDRNNDALHFELRELINCKENNGDSPLSAVRIPDEDTSETRAAARRGSSRAMKNLNTVSLVFRQQMSRLVSLIDSTSPHFIRCVKPNANKRAKDWDEPLVEHQLKYLGVMETVRIRREGYPIRRDFGEFIQEFPLLQRMCPLKWVKGENDREVCAAILRMSGKNEGDGWQLGNTRCFVSDDVMDRLARKVNRMKHRGALKFQMGWRAFLARRTLGKRRQEYLERRRRRRNAAATKIQAIVRAMIAKRRAEKARREKRRHDAAISIQTAWRRFCAYEDYTVQKKRGNPAPIHCKEESTQSAVCAVEGKHHKNSSGCPGSSWSAKAYLRVECSDKNADCCTQMHRPEEVEGSSSKALRNKDGSSHKNPSCVERHSQARCVCCYENGSY